MQAVIMAGGFGTRLRPITCNLPKPMTPVANKHLLCHIINLLKKHNFHNLTMVLYYQPEIIMNYFGTGKNLGLNIKYIRPEMDLGTAGSVKFASKNIKDTFLVVSGDILTDVELSKAVEFHKKKKAIATIVLTRVDNPLRFGVVVTDENGRINRFLEKPSWGEVFSDTINTGIYILEPEIFNFTPFDQTFDFSKDLFPFLLKNNKDIYGYIADCYWKDIGNFDEYRMVHYDILDEKVKIDIEAKKVRITGKEIVAGSNISIGKKVEIDGQVIFGDNVIIEDGANISRSVIGSNVKIGADSKVSGCVLWDNVIVGTQANLKENIVGSSTKIGDRTVIQIGAVVADKCTIGYNSVIRTNLRIWPYKVIEAGSIVSSSLIWGEKWNKALFNTYGISGLGNTEVTPEFAAKIGSSYGAYVGASKYVITSRDEHPASKMIERGIIAGLLSAGVNVGDLRGLPIPIVRHEICNEGGAGGIYIRQSPRDVRAIDIKFFNSKGADISLNQEKAIEQLFFGEDFKRADMGHVGEVTIPQQTVECYKTCYLSSIKKDVLKKTRQKIVIDYAYSSASVIFPAILDELEVDVVALNAFINSSKITKSSEEFYSSLRQLSDIVTTLKANAGFLIDTGAEKLFLVDDNGKIIQDDMAMFIISYLVMKINRNRNIKIAVPINASSVIDKIAARFGVKVKRTATSSRNLMTVENEKSVVLVCDSMGGFIFPEFQNAFDAMYAIGKVIEMTAKEELSISEIMSKIPYFEVLHETVSCSWDKKGQTMRKALEEVKDKKVELVDGIKIYLNNSWVLFVPDPDEALFHIWAEAKDTTTTLKLLKMYVDKIKNWQK